MVSDLTRGAAEPASARGDPQAADSQNPGLRDAAA